jgi:hypothetical protein
MKEVAIRDVDNNFREEIKTSPKQFEFLTLINDHCSLFRIEILKYNF